MKGESENISWRLADGDAGEVKMAAINVAAPDIGIKAVTAYADTINQQSWTSSKRRQ